MRTLSVILGSVVLTLASSVAVKADLQVLVLPPLQASIEFDEVVCMATNDSNVDETMSFELFDATGAGVVFDFIPAKPHQTSTIKLSAYTIGQGQAPFSCSIASSDSFVATICSQYRPPGISACTGPSGHSHSPP